MGAKLAKRSRRYLLIGCAWLSLASCSKSELVGSSGTATDDPNAQVSTAGAGNTGALGPDTSSGALPISNLIGGASIDPNVFWPPTGQSCGTRLANSGSVPTHAPQAYLDACAGCHGPTGSGHANYPNIRGARDLAAFTLAVRDGSQGVLGEMPFFKQSWLDDDELRRIYAYLTASPLVETQQCADVPPMGNANIALALTAGLQIWRTQDGRTDPNGIVTNVACVQCHAPDPLDIAYYGYSDGDILRRGLLHLPAVQVANIVDMVHALREKYHIGRRMPLQVRPFQPGGGLLDGNSIAERDAAFGAEIVQLGLSVATTPINSPSDANRAIDAVWGVDRHLLRIPIPFNRYTEDGFHNADGYVPDCLDDIDACDDHGSIAEWIPVAPHIPASLSSMFAAMDAYLANPNDASFNLLKQSLPSGDTMPGTYAYATRALDDKKYRSVMLANYCLQLEVRGLAGCYDKGLTPFPNQADPWDIGSTANLFGSNYELYPTCDTQWSSCGAAPANLTQWPTHVLGDLTPGATLSSNFSRLRHPWMTLWWVHFDPTLLVTGDPTAQKDEYFTRSLFWANDNDEQFDGTPQAQAHPAYAIFAAYEVLLHNIATLKNPQLASCSLYPATDFPCTEVDVRSGYYPDVINFAEQNQPQSPESTNNVHYQTRYQPTDAARRATYQMLTSNLYRVFFWKLIGALQEDPWMCRPDLQALRIVRAREFLTQAETQQSNAAQDALMFSTLATLMQSAPTSCPALSTTVP